MFLHSKENQGGSGAPKWTLELAGLDPEKVYACAAAHIHSESLATHTSVETCDLWCTNGSKFAACTMSTLFWAGQTFAPKSLVPKCLHARATELFSDADDDEINIQTFLQRSLVAAIGVLADRLSGCTAVIGFEPFNEPHVGYCGLASLQRWDPMKNVILGLMPTALQSFALASGFSQNVPLYGKAIPYSKLTGTVRINPPAHGLWLDGRSCVWQQHELWGLDEQDRVVGLKEGGFCYHPSHPHIAHSRSEYFLTFPDTAEPFVWWNDAFLPFIRAAGRRIHHFNRDWMIALPNPPTEVGRSLSARCCCSAL